MWNSNQNQRSSQLNQAWSQLAAQGQAQSINQLAAAQQQQSNQWAALQNLGRAQQARAEYMIAGQIMTREQFISEVYPQDTPERTWFLLRFPG